MRIMVALEPVDGRKGIDSLARLCRETLQEDPFSGCLFIFRCRSGTSIRLLCYDSQGFILAQKRLSTGKFRWWPSGEEAGKTLESYQAQVLLAAGDPAVRAAPAWRSVQQCSQRSRILFCQLHDFRGRGSKRRPWPEIAPPR
jgi:transposase